STQLTRTAAAEQLASRQAKQLGQQLFDIRFPRAIAAIHDGQLDLARENLNECPEAERGWEWKFLARQAGLNLPEMIRGRQFAQFTPDGNQIVAVDATDEKSIKFWNASTGAEIRTIAASATPIKEVCLDGEGRKLATGTDDGTISMWDVASGQQRWCV